MSHFAPAAPKTSAILTVHPIPLKHPLRLAHFNPLSWVQCTVQLCHVQSPLSPVMVQGSEGSAIAQGCMALLLVGMSISLGSPWSLGHVHAVP